MAWRIHLTDDAIFRIDLLSGNPHILCAWITGTYVAFFDIESGASLGRFRIEPPQSDINKHDSAEWQLFLKDLKALNGVALPVIRLKNLTIHSIENGNQHLYDDGDTLSVQSEQRQTRLTTNTPYITVAMDRQSGAIAALDKDGKLIIYHNHILSGCFNIGLKPEYSILPEIIMAENGAAIFASDGQRLVRTTSNGTVQKTRTMPYLIGKIACSPNGVYCATSDPETGIIRVYTGADLAFTHQKFAIDLYADAPAIQLLADIATPRIAVNALKISNTGIIAFAIDGIITVSHINTMEKMLRPQSLL